MLATNELTADETSNNAVNFFNQAQHIFAQAKQQAGMIEHTFRIANQPVCFQFAADALIPKIAPAFEHLRTDPVDHPALTICLWDSASTGVQMPTPPWSGDDYLARGLIQGYNDSRISTLHDLGTRSLSMFDRDQQCALYWTRDAEKTRDWERGAPLFHLFNWWLIANDLQFTHGAAVGLEQGCVIMPGKGGSGKSTTALACLNSPLQHISEDYCIVSTDSTPTVYSIYNTAKVDGNTIQKFPDLIPWITNAEFLNREKALIYLQQHYPEKLVNSLPLRAILVPSITGKKDTYITATSPAVALRALAPSTIFQLTKTVE